MPFEVEIDSKAQRVTSRWHGVVTAATLSSYIEQIWADAAVRNFSELIDFHGVTEVDVPSEALYAFAESSRALDNPDRPTRTAVVAPAGLIFGLSRMFFHHPLARPRRPSRVPGFWRRRDSARMAEWRCRR